jgi:uncharacterized repeat protein (TIGR01451 family)
MPRIRLTIGALAVMAAVALFGAASAGSAPVVGTDVLYTLDADFDQGTLVNVNHDAPNSNQLQLNTASGTFPFIWVALSLRCTIAKINTETGAILGEYRTISDGQFCQESSRTTVSIDGSVWVGHRGPGGITHVGLVELNQCLDRNGNGTIETSGAYGDVKAWPGADGNVANATDECILHHLNSDATGLGFSGGADTRHVSIDADNKLWVGSNNTGGEFVRVNGNTGVVETPVFDRPCGGYGGLIDGNGVIWSAQGSLLRWDPDAADSAGTNPRCLNTGHSVYGVAVDAAGSIWTSSLGGNSVRKTSSDGNSTSGTFGHGSENAQGLAVDGDGDVWVSSSLFCSSGCTIGHLKNNGTFVGNVPTPTGAGSTGIAVDAAGKIWSANRNSNTATRIDPDAGPIGLDGVTPVGAVDLTVNFPATPGRPLPFPYNYSDMTGAQLFSNTAPQGSWTVVQDGGDPGAEWGTITWNTEPQGSVPAGTAITVEARAAETEAGLGAQAYVAVSNGAEFTLTGRFIQVRATLQANDDGVSPILSDIRIEGGAEADISIDKTAPAQVTEGDVFSFSLAVKNNGPDDATSATASDTLPAGVTYVSSSTTQGSCSQLGGTVSCSLGDLAAGATATVTITVLASGPGPYVNNASAAAEEDDPNPANNHDTTTTNLNHNPACTATASGPEMWPPNHKLVRFTVGGATDPDGDVVLVTITGVTQDEPVNGDGDGNTAPDAFIVSPTTVDLRAERTGGGDGRVYKIVYSVSDGEGGSCTGSTTVSVPHDRSGAPAVDSSPPSYNSLAP